MKILHVSKYYPPYIGGTETICHNIVSCITDFEQKVICFNDTRISVVSNIDGIEIIRAGSFGEFKSQPISWSIYRILKQYIKTFKPEIIHFHLPNPLVCLYILLLIPRSIKLVLHWHLDIVAQKRLYKLFMPIERKILKRADRVLVTSPNYLKHSLPLCKYKHKSVVLPNMVITDKMELDKQDDIRVTKLLSVYNNKRIVFFLGRHVTYKGLEYLIKAEKYIHSDCIILIAGGGSLTKQLKQMATSKRIKFVGRISDEEVKIYMHAASVFAFPSITKNEAFGIALAEAMYCRAVPVTFTIEGAGVNWVNLKDVTGLEVENKNARKFGEAIDSLLKDEELRTKLAENGYWRVVNNFTPNAIKPQIESIYKSLMFKN